MPFWNNLQVDLGFLHRGRLRRDTSLGLPLKHGALSPRLGPRIVRLPSTIIGRGT